MSTADLDLLVDRFASTFERLDEMSAIEDCPRKSLTSSDGKNGAQLAWTQTHRLSIHPTRNSRRAFLFCLND